MFWEFLRLHCYKLVITALALMVAIEYGLGVLYEESRHINEVYFTFNVTLPMGRNDSSSADAANSDYSYNSPNMTLVALQSTNSSDPFPVNLLNASETVDANGRPSTPCPLVSPLLGELTFSTNWVY